MAICPDLHCVLFTSVMEFIHIFIISSANLDDTLSRVSMPCILPIVDNSGIQRREMMHCINSTMRNDRIQYLLK